VTEGGRQRPNAKYKLSKPDNVVPRKEELVFYYNREHRLAKASKDVQDLYKDKKGNRFGFFRVLVADKHRKLLFLSIVLICVVIWILGLLGYFDKSYTFDGNKIIITQTVFEDTTLIVINKTIKNKNAYTGAVDVAVSIPISLETESPSQIENNTPVFYHRIFFTLEKEEQYRFAVPFESAELLFVLQTEKNSLKLKLTDKLTLQ
jgi:hypothetical protein